MTDNILSRYGMGRDSYPIPVMRPLSTCAIGTEN
jgi:hypothetical protein